MQTAKCMVWVMPIFVLFACNSTKNINDQNQLMNHAKALHGKMATIDTHNDTPLSFLRNGFDFSGVNNKARNSKVDLKKMEDGGLDGAFFAVFIGQGERTPEAYEKVNKRALEIFDAINIQVNNNSARAAIATKPNDIYKLKKEGKRSIYLGVENGYPIGTDLSNLHKYYELGARYVTLCHTKNNQICDSSTDPNGPEHNGLSSFGKEVVKEMNKMGMIIDVSHISDKSFNDVIELSKAPVIASHSCARAICDNPRNLSDEMLKLLASKGGVIQMCILSDYVKKTEPNAKRDSARRALRIKYNNFQNLSEEQEKQATADWYKMEENFPANLATVSDVVDHIDHMVKIMGIEHVGIGTDFDGGGGVDGCKDVSQMMNITVELIRRGYSDSDIKKIWGENFMKVFKQVEKIASELK